MACEGCCRVDQNESTYMPEKANPIKDDQVMLAGPPLRKPNLVVSQSAAPPPPAAPAKVDVESTSGTGEFAGAWEDTSKNVCVISETGLRWANSVLSKVSVSGGTLRLEDADATATLDDTKNMLTWSDGDVWKRIVVLTEFAGLWQDDSKGVHTIMGTTLKWCNGTTSDVVFSEGILRLDDNKLTASLDDSKTKLSWSDGDVWTKTEKPANSSEFAGAWKDADDKIHTITDTTLNWSNMRASAIKVEAGTLVVADLEVTATLDETISKLTWNDGDVWTRTTSAAQAV